MSNATVIDKFKSNVLLLAHNFKAMNNSAIDSGYKFVDNGIMAFIELYLSRVDARDMLETFVTYSHKYWREIADRDTTFFHEHAEEVFDFSGSCDAEINDVVGEKKNIFMFKQLLTTPGAVSEDDIDLIWTFFDVLVKLSWKALLEDESGKSGSNPWLPANVRNLALNYDGLESCVAKIEGRKRKK